MLKWWRCCKGGLCCAPLPAPPQEKPSLLHSCAQPNAGLCIPGSAAGREGRECNKGVQKDQGGPPPQVAFLGALNTQGLGSLLQHRAWRGFTCTKNRLGATGCVLMKEESIRLRAAQPPGAADCFFPPSFSLSLTLCCCLRGSHERSEARSSFSLAFRLKKKNAVCGEICAEHPIKEPCPALSSASCRPRAIHQRRAAARLSAALCCANRTICSDQRGGKAEKRCEGMLWEAQRSSV